MWRRCHAERSRSGSSRALPPGSGWSRWDRARDYLSVVAGRAVAAHRASPGATMSGTEDDIYTRRTESGSGTPGRWVRITDHEPQPTRRLLAVPAAVALVLGMTACDDNRAIGGDDPGPTDADRVRDVRLRPTPTPTSPAGWPACSAPSTHLRRDHGSGLGRPPGRRHRLPRRAVRRPVRRGADRRDGRGRRDDGDRLPRRSTPRTCSGCRPTRSPCAEPRARRTPTAAPS